MRTRDLASLALVGAVAGWVVVALVRPPAEPPPVPRQFFQVAPGEAVDLVVPPEGREGRLIVAAVLEDEAPPEGPVTWEVGLSWMDAEGRVVDAVQVEERSRVDWLPGTLREPEVRRTSRILGDRAWVTEGRVLYVPLEGLPDGGNLRVEARGGHPLLIRAFAEVGLPEDRLDLVLDAPVTRQVRRAETALQVPDLEGLTGWERARVLSRLWRRLEPVDGGGERTRPVVAVPPMAGEARGVRTVRIEPGRGIALNLLGPGEVRVSGPMGVADLAYRCVGDGRPCALHVEPAEPVGLAGAEEAVWLVRPPGEVGPASLRIDNQGEAAVDLVLTAPKAVRWFGRPPVVDLASLYPDDGLGDPLWVGPEVRSQVWAQTGEQPLRWAVWGTADEAVRLTARPVLEHREDRRTREIEVRGVDDDRVVWSGRWRVPSAPAPLEGLEDRWVGEPAVSWVVPGGARTVEVRGQEPVLVRLHAEGVPREGAEDYLAPGGSAVRFAAEPATTLRNVPPLQVEELEASGQRAVLRGVVRLEPSARADGVARTWRSLGGGDGAEPWLFPSATASEAPVACQVPAGVEAEVADPEATDWTRGVLWAGPALGEPFEVRLDGARWTSGRLRQAARVVQGVAPPFQRVELQGPPDAVFWVQGTPGTRCDAPRAVRMLSRLDPGEQAVFEVEGHEDGRLLYLSGAGEGVASLQVRLPTVSGAGLHATPARRALLLAGEGPIAQSLYDPSLRRPALQGRAIRLGGDVRGGSEVVVRNEGPTTVWVRALLEGVPSRGDAGERVRVVPGGAP